MRRGGGQPVTKPVTPPPLMTNPFINRWPVYSRALRHHPAAMFRLILALALLPLPAAADPGALRTAALSARMFHEGVARKDPLLMISAARLRKSLRLVPGADLLSATDMLDTAETLAAADPVLLGLIADIRAETTRGVASGQIYNLAEVAPGMTDAYMGVAFAGGIYAEVYVEPLAETDLNLMVYDDQDKLVCQDRDPSPIAYCGWTPATDGPFLIKVENLGAVAAPYALMTN